MASAITLTTVVMTVSPSTFQVGQTGTLSCLNTFSDSSQTTTCSTLNSSQINSAPTATLSGTTITGLSPGATNVAACFNNGSGSCTGTATGGTFSVTPPNVEYLGTIPSSQVAGGLGFNLNTTTDLEWQVAKAAGASYGRFQSSWVGVEIQSAPPGDTSGGYALDSNSVAALNSASTWSLKPTIVAAYGAPYHNILTVTVPAGASAGATSLGITFSSGVGGSTISSMRAVWNTIGTSSGLSFLSPQHDYSGVIITGVTVTSGTTATITLASALTSSLPADGTTYKINEYLYQSPTTASSTQTNNINFANYAQYLGQQIAAKGLSGWVELWNEPPWPDSCWDNYGDCFDTYGGGATIGAGVANQGFAAAIQNLTQPTGVSYIWAGTNKSGDGTLLGGNMLSRSGLALTQPSVKISSESIHPYGNNPEDHMWSGPCQTAAAAAGGANSVYKYACNLFGVNGGNFAESAAYDATAKFANAANGLSRSMTETGVSGLTQTQSSRFVMRQFLGFQASGITPVEFYRLYDTGGAGYSFGNISGGVFTPYQQYTSLQALMTDVNAIKLAPPATVSSASLIASSSGLTWPLDSVQIVGALHGTDSVNSVMVAAWQRTYNNSGNWTSISSPTGGSITVNIPSGTVVAKVIDTVTLSSVSYTTAGGQITLPVADDPVEMLFEPITSATLHNLGIFNGKFN